MRDRWLSFYGVSLLGVIAFYRGMYGVRVIGRDNVPANGPVILAANHIAFLDPPAVGAAFAPRHVSYLAKSELFRFKPLGWLISNLNAFPVDRSRGDTGAIRKSVAILKEGRALLVFPEGGRNVDGKAEAKNGVAFLAKLSGAPVIPVYIHGTKNAKFRQPVTVAFGKPMHYDPALGKSTEAMSQWREELMANIYGLAPAQEGDPSRYAHS
jgi:1-acyl-sn-glycerol-3-phosphate acyltransferase